jgi:hypothetical protein
LLLVVANFMNDEFPLRADKAMPNLGGNSADETSEMASGSTMTPNTELRKRRSTRIVQAVPLAVTGVDALGRPFTERTSTLIINCHGCRYQSKHYVLKNMWVTLEIPHSESGHATRSVRGRVAWIQRPRTVRQLFQVALELEQPGNAWGMAFPPEDWFGFPEAEKQHHEGFAEGAAETSGLPEFPEGQQSHGGSSGTPGSSAEFNLPLGEAPDSPPVSGADKVRIFPSPVSATDASLQLARQMTRLLNDAKQQIQAAARDAATQAVSSERHTAFAQWEQKFAAARVEVANEAARAIDKLQQHAEEQAKKLAESASESTEKARIELPLSFTPKLEELTRELAAKLHEEAAAQRAQFERQAVASAETLQGLRQHIEDAVNRLTALREGAEKHLEERVRSAAHSEEEAKRSLEEAARTAEEARRAVEEAAREPLTALAAQSAALLATVEERERRLQELLRTHSEEMIHAHARAVELTQTAAEASATSLAAGLGEVKMSQEAALEAQAAVQSAMQEAWRAQLSQDVDAARARWQAVVEQSVAGATATAQEHAAQGLESRAHGVGEQISEQLREQLTSQLQEAGTRQIETHIAALNETASRVTGELERRTTEIREAAGHGAHTAVTEALRGSVQDAVDQAVGNAIGRAVDAAVTRVHTEAEQHVAGLRDSLGAAVEGRAKEPAERLEALLAKAGDALARLEHFSSQLTVAQEDSLHGFRAQLDDILALHRNELHRRSESLFEEINGRIRSAFAEATRESVQQFEQQVTATVQPHIVRAEEAVHRLAGGRSLLDAAMTLQQERIRGFADETFAESLGRFRESLGTVEQVLQDSARGITEQSLGDLEGKVQEVKQQAIDDVLKSAEWYEKKAQTQIQNSTEKVVEQIANQLREKAGEVSSTFASEVDHASRNFVGHTQSQMEEVLRDAFARSRGLFAEAAETTAAAFTDEIQRTARQELAGFGDEVHRATGELRGEIESARVELALRTTAEQEDFLRRFHSGMNQAMEISLAEAHKNVEASFVPLLESVRNLTSVHQEEVRGIFQQAGEQAAEEHREKLHGISNQWMLATVASLDQQARGLVNNIAATAEEQIRAACEQVFAEIGETLRDLLANKAKGQSA